MLEVKREDSQLYCFELAVDYIIIGDSIDCSDTNGFFIAFQFLKFPPVTIIDKFSLVPGAKTILQIGKCCYFSLSRAALSAELHRQGHLLIFLKTRESMIGKSKIKVEAEPELPGSVVDDQPLRLGSKGTISLLSDTGTSIGDIRISYRLETMTRNFNNQSNVTALSLKDSKDTQTQALRPDSHDTSVQTARKLEKQRNKTCQTARLRLSSRQIQTLSQEKKHHHSSESDSSRRSKCSRRRNKDHGDSSRSNASSHSRSNKYESETSKEAFPGKNSLHESHPDIEKNSHFDPELLTDSTKPQISESSRNDTIPQVDLPSFSETDIISVLLAIFKRIVPPDRSVAGTCPTLSSLAREIDALVIRKDVDQLANTIPRPRKPPIGLRRDKNIPISSKDRMKQMKSVYGPPQKWSLAKSHNIIAQTNAQRVLRFGHTKSSALRYAFTPVYQGPKRLERGVREYRNPLPFHKRVTMKDVATTYDEAQDWARTHQDQLIQTDLLDNSEEMNKRGQVGGMRTAETQTERSASPSLLRSGRLSFGLAPDQPLTSSFYAKSGRRASQFGYHLVNKVPIASQQSGSDSSKLTKSVSVDVASTWTTKGSAKLAPTTSNPSGNTDTAKAGKLPEDSGSGNSDHEILNTSIMLNPAQTRRRLSSASHRPHMELLPITGQLKQTNRNNTSNQDVKNVKEPGEKDRKSAAEAAYSSDFSSEESDTTETSSSSSLNEARVAALMEKLGETSDRFMSSTTPPKTTERTSSPEKRFPGIPEEEPLQIKLLESPSSSTKSVASDSEVETERNDDLEGQRSTDTDTVPTQTSPDSTSLPTVLTSAKTIKDEKPDVNKPKPSVEKRKQFHAQRSKLAGSRGSRSADKKNENDEVFSPSPDLASLKPGQLSPVSAYIQKFKEEKNRAANGSGNINSNVSNFKERRIQSVNTESVSSYVPSGFSDDTSA